MADNLFGLTFRFGAFQVHGRLVTDGLSSRRTVASTKYISAATCEHAVPSLQKRNKNAFSFKFNLPSIDFSVMHSHRGHAKPTFETVKIVLYCLSSFPF